MILIGGDCGHAVTPKVNSIAKQVAASASCPPFNFNSLAICVLPQTTTPEKIEFVDLAYSIWRADNAWMTVSGQNLGCGRVPTMRELSVNATPLIAEYAFKQACPRDVEM